MLIIQFSHMPFNTADSYLRGGLDGYKDWLNNVMPCQFSFFKEDNWCVLSFSITAIISSAILDKCRWLFSTYNLLVVTCLIHHPLLFLESHSVWTTIKTLDSMLTELLVDLQLLSTRDQSAVLLLCRTMAFFIRWGNKYDTEAKSSWKRRLEVHSRRTVNFYLTQFMFKKEIISLPFLVVPP